jgi:hypothetical protein
VPFELLIGTNFQPGSGYTRRPQMMAGRAEIENLRGLQSLMTKVRPEQPSEIHRRSVRRWTPESADGQVQDTQSGRRRRGKLTAHSLRWGRRAVEERVLTDRQRLEMPSFSAHTATASLLPDPEHENWSRDGRGPAVSSPRLPR